MEYLACESDHYIFHYFPGSRAEKDIIQIITEQEYSFRRITDTLRIKPPFKIQYWLCHTPEEVGRICGDNEPCNGFAREPDTIYVVYNDAIQCIGPHEDAHLLSYLINIPTSVFLREGLAMYFDQIWWGKSNDEWTAGYIRDGKILPIRKLMQDDVFYSLDCGVTYPIAGSFTKYLIDCFGLDSYLKFYQYTGSDWNEAMQLHFGCTSEMIGRRFRDRLDRIIDIENADR